MESSRGSRRRGGRRENERQAVVEPERRTDEGERRLVSTSTTSSSSSGPGASCRYSATLRLGDRDPAAGPRDGAGRRCCAPNAVRTSASSAGTGSLDETMAPTERASASASARALPGLDGTTGGQLDVQGDARRHRHEHDQRDHVLSLADGERVHGWHQEVVDEEGTGHRPGEAGQRSAEHAGGDDHAEQDEQVGGQREGLGVGGEQRRHRGKAERTTAHRPAGAAPGSGSAIGDAAAADPGRPTVPGDHVHVDRAGVPERVGDHRPFTSSAQLDRWLAPITTWVAACDRAKSRASSRRRRPPPRGRCPRGR